jgi:SAM-dependent methyltransferase
MHVKARPDWEDWLLDQDEGALRRAKERMGRRDGQIAFHCESVLHFIVRQKRDRQLGERDLIYATGLLDYFTVSSSRKIVQALWPAVAPGGRLIVTNAHPGNPTRAWMEWAADWFLVYKDERAMRSLGEGLDGTASVSVQMDPFGVYQDLIVTRTG